MHEKNSLLPHCLTQKSSYRKSTFAIKIIYVISITLESSWVEVLAQGLNLDTEASLIVPTYRNNF